MILTSYGMQSSSPGPRPGQYYDFVISNSGTVESLGCTKDASALMESANFLVIPSGYGPGRIYAENPLDYNGFFPFSRTSTATFINQNGLVQLTGSAYNLYTYSEDFTNAVWTKLRINITGDAITAPDGSMTADQAVIASSGALRIRRATANTVVAGQQYVYSTYVKSGTGATGLSICSYLIGNGSETSVSAGAFDLSSLTFTGATSPWITGRTYQSLSNEWVRLIFNVTIPVGETTLGITVVPGSSSNAISGDIGKFIYIWGSQLTLGSEILPYQYVGISILALPRLDYRLGRCPAILLEPLRTNLCTASEDFSNAYYNYNVPATGSILVTTNQIIAPDGTLTADKLSSGTNTGIHQFRCSSNGFQGTVSTASVFAKAGELSRFRLGVSASASNSIDFNVSTGSITAINGAGTTGFIENYGNGWYRCITTGTIGSVCDSYILDNSGNQSYTGNGTDGLYLWGYQFESRGTTGQACQFATSYIPTAGTTVTRAVDVLQSTNITSAGFVGSSGGTMMMYFRNNIPYQRDVSARIGIGDTSAMTQNSVYTLSSTGSKVIIQKNLNSSSSALLNTALIPGDELKWVLKWDGSNLDLFVNGQKIALNSTQRSFPVVNPLQFFGIGGGTPGIPYYIQDMALFNTTLSDDECIQLSSL